MLRSFGAVLVGFLVGSIVNMALIQLNLVLFPPPPGLDLADPAAFKTLIASMKPAAWVLVFVAHMGQAFVGAAVAARLTESRPMRMAMILGVLSLAAGIANATMLSMPRWTWVEMPFYLVAAWIAGRLEESRRAAA